MEKISYTLNLEDCRDYVKYQRKIPRIKKFLLKQFLPLLYLCLAILFISLFFEIISLFMWINSIGTQYSMSFFEVLRSEYFLPLIESLVNHFVTVNTPVVLIWLVLFATAWIFSKYDIFHVESNKVYALLKGQDLDIEITPEEDGLFCRGKHTKIFYDWKKIIDVYDTGKSFLVFVGDYAALVIPKRAFETLEEEKIFFNYLNNKLDQK